MSSLTQAFALLNNSIRGIKRDREQHEVRMAQLDMAREQDEERRNDPRLKFEKAKAAAEMEVGAFDTGLSGREMSPKDHEHFNNYIKPAIADIIPEDTELNDDNQIVWAGTNEVVELPKWKRDALRADIDIAMATAVIGNNKLDLEIDKLQDEVKSHEEMLRNSGDAKTKINSIQLRSKKAKLATMMKEQASPQGRIKRLLSTNMELNKMYKAAMMHPNVSNEVFSRIEGLRSVNNQEIKALASMMPDKTGENLTSVTYTRVDPTSGAKIEREVIMPKLMVGNAPEKRMYGDGEYTLGTISNLPTAKQLMDQARGSEGAGWDLTEPQKNTINKDVTKAKTILSVATMDVGYEERVKQMVMSGDVDPDEADLIATMLETNAKDVRDNQIDLLKKYARYMDADWFVDLPTEIKSAIKTERKIEKKTEQSKMGADPLNLFN